MISSNNNYVEKYEKPEVANGRFRNRNSKDWVENANFSSKFADFIQNIEGKKKVMWCSNHIIFKEVKNKSCAESFQI